MWGREKVRVMLWRGVDEFSGCRRCEMIPIAAGAMAIRFDYYFSKLENARSTGPALVAIVPKNGERKQKAL